MKNLNSGSGEEKIMDVESGKKVLKNRKLMNICIGLGVAVILLILVMVILAFTVFKAKDPVVTIDSVAVDGLKVSLDIARMGVTINLTLDLDLSVENPNKVGMKYENSSSLLYYRGEQVGEVPIPAGKISADETVGMKLTLTLMADRFLSNSQAFSDVRSGALPLSTYTKISGKVSIFNMFNIHVDSSSTCNFTVFISNNTVGDQQCTYKNSL